MRAAARASGGTRRSACRRKAAPTASGGATPTDRWKPYVEDEVLAAHALPDGVSVVPTSVCRHAGATRRDPSVSSRAGATNPTSLVLASPGGRVVVVRRSAQPRRASAPCRPIRHGQLMPPGNARDARRFALRTGGDAPAGSRSIEILVALAIVAVALAAGMRSVAQSTDVATSLKQRTLALWVAQNRLAAAQLANPWPDLGARTATPNRPTRAFVWRETICGTPNPGFRKIEILSPTRRSPTTRWRGWSATSGNRRRDCTRRATPRREPRRGATAASRCSSSWSPSRSSRSCRCSAIARCRRSPTARCG